MDHRLDETIYLLCGPQQRRLSKAREGLLMMSVKHCVTPSGKPTANESAAKEAEASQCAERVAVAQLNEITEIAESKIGERLAL